MKAPRPPFRWVHPAWAEALEASSARRAGRMHMRASFWAGTALVFAHASHNVQAQTDLAPWISTLPGLEHPVGWDWLDGTSIGIQRTPRWDGQGTPLESLWLGAGRPSGNNGQQTNRMSDRPAGLPAFGITISRHPQASGWTQTQASAAAAASVELSRRWQGSAGCAMGWGAWQLDPANWSWDQQYGTGGYDPGAPSGEPTGAGGTAGGHLVTSVSLGIRSFAPGQRQQGVALSAAATVHNFIPIEAPHLAPVHADSARKALLWWTQMTGPGPQSNAHWRLWMRGGWQGNSRMAEWGGAMAWSLGAASRYTQASRAHSAELGLLLRNEGTLRLSVGWSRDGLALWSGPGWNVSGQWRPPPGWAMGLVWNSLRSGNVALHRH